MALGPAIEARRRKRIILGGGRMHQKQWFPLIRTQVKRILNGYVHSPMVAERKDEYIVPPGLGDQAGLPGAIALAKQPTLKTDFWPVSFVGSGINR